MVQKTHALKDRSIAATLPEGVDNHLITRWLRKHGWMYHPHQLEVLKAAQEGKDVLLTAPTGAGKTLAGFLPSFVGRLENPRSPKDRPAIHTLYISPLKALTVDVHRNVGKPIDEMAIPITYETRTGDTPASKRQRQKDKPPDFLMTTPESVALLLSYEEAEIRFASLRYVIIDELHALMHSKRGDLLMLNLARLQKLTPEMRVIGLSATLSDPDAALRYLQGDEKRKGAVIRADEVQKPEIEILNASKCYMPWSGYMARYAMPEIYSAIKSARLSIIFVNTRAQSEYVFQNLWDLNEDGLRIAVHHGSLDKHLRRKVEAHMAEGKLDCVVATASLDLGLDWGDVDLVIQIGAPKGVSRLMQRIGRSNHRLDRASRAILVPSNRFEYLECMAAIEGVHKGIQDVIPRKEGGFDVLAQHIIGRLVSSPASKEEIYDEVVMAAPYRNLSPADYENVFAYVKNGGYALSSYERYARLKQDDEGRHAITHPLFVRQYRMNIGTIVESAMVKVKLKMRTLGKIEEWFIQNLSKGDTFLFGGQVLRYKGLSNQGVQVSKTADKSPKIPSYAGGRMPLSTHLSSAVRATLSNPERWSALPETVTDWLKLQRNKACLPDEEGLLLESFPRTGKHYMVVYSFEGRNAHQTLGFLLSRRMQRYGLKPLGFVATDYALALWSVKPVDHAQVAQALFSTDLLGDDLEQWLEDTPLLKRNFRDCAVIAGLIERRHPGQQKTGKQVSFSSDLIYDVLMQYEPDHILLEAAYQDAASGLIDIGRISDFLTRIQGKITLNCLSQVSPLAVPLILQVSRESLSKDLVNDYYLESLEEELLKEAGFPS